MVRFFHFIFLCTSLSNLVNSLDLANKGTRLKPTVVPQKGATSTTTKAPKDDSGIAVYRLINSDTDTTCILLKTDAVVEINFKLHGVDTRADSFIPEKAMVDGKCSDESDMEMLLSWPGYRLTMSFAKAPGGELWYISNMELGVSVDLPQLHGIKMREKTLRLYNTSVLLRTPVGRSYLCDDEVDIDLRPDPNHRNNPNTKDIFGTLLLRALQVQAFMYRSENFSTPYHCKAQRSFRSETAPIAVGSTLAIAALAIVTGYGAFRYFKVKNVQYNTME